MKINTNKQEKEDKPLLNKNIWINLNKQENEDKHKQIITVF